MGSDDFAKNQNEARPPLISLIFPALKMGSATLLSRLLGLVREQAMAFYFGATGVMDAFLVAYRIPNLMRDLFAEGAFSSAFVPVFTEKMQKDPAYARRLLWTLFICLLAVTGVFSLIIIFFAPGIVSFFAPAFAKDRALFELTVSLVRIMSPFLALVSVAALFMGALNALKVFFVPALAPAIFNVTMIVSMVTSGFIIERGFFRDSAGLGPIVLVAFGVCLGGLLQGLIQFPCLLAKKMGPTLRVDFFDKNVRRVFKKLGPGLLGFASTQINLVVNTILATSTVVGAVSWLSFAFRLFQFPVGIMGVSVANSNLVLFSEAWKKGDRKRALATLKQAIRLSLFLLLPAAALLWALCLPMVQVVFERGEFGPRDSLNTAKALGLYSLGLPFYGLYKVFVPVFYALDKEKIPVLTSALSVGFNVAFCVALVPHYGFAVLALGMGVSIFLNISIQALALKRCLACPWGVFFDVKTLKMTVASLLAALGIALAQSSWGAGEVFSQGLGGRLLSLISYALCGVFIYGISLLLMGEKLAKRSFRDGPSSH
ncbi:MAG: murein biosynthesis integral membrane protein MurJ [Bacteriovoracales bacterium]|nr:murein biosynthesis integral membrane protein MurJ [Bacteriovoracales bacterium]